MTSSSGDLHIEWLVACLSPGDVAPHPNFKSDSAKGAELLALVVQFKWREYATYRDLSEDGQENQPGTPIERYAIPDAARQALESVSILDGLNRLVAEAEDDELALGQRAAAALLAAISSSELDKPDAYVSLLAELASAIQDSTLGGSSSRNLATGILLQQCAFQSLQSGRKSEARAFASKVVETLADLDDDWDDFAVSRGISWNAAVSQRRLTELTTSNARSLLVNTGDHLDRSWTEVVRAPFPNAAARPVQDALSAMTTVVDEIFKQKYSPRGRQGIILGGGDTALQLLYSSLLNAELTGNMARTARLRQTVGNVFAVRLSSEPNYLEWYEEAIRLFRQGDSEDHLRPFLDNLRAQGSFATIKLAAEKLIDTRNSQEFVTSADLALIDFAADLISTLHCDRGLGLAIRYASQNASGRVKGSRAADWSLVEKALKTANAIVSGNRKVDMEYIASSTLKLVDFPRSAADQLIFSAMARLASKINWPAVSVDVRAEWAKTVEVASQSPDVLAIDCIRVYAALDAPKPKEVLSRLDGLEHTAALIEGLLGEPPSSADLDKAVETVGSTLDSMRQDAVNGVYTGYTWSPFAMAAYLIASQGRTDLWPRLTAALSDPALPNDGKLDALDALMSHAWPLKLPPEVKSELTSKSIPWAGHDLDHTFFALPEGQFDAACRSFYLAFDIATPEEMQMATLRDVGSRESRVRSEAARACFFAAVSAPALEWPEIILIQLSHDQDPRVMRNVSKWLAYLSVLPDLALGNAVADRVISLLARPGLAVALGALEGLAAARRDQALTPETLWCEQEVRALFDLHGSRIVRDSAETVLNLYGRRPTVEHRE
ncbi:hypothetical protein [Kribbella jiaozuonensis]|uniref:Uncharacterized protein n=1 Tax=Kribbella jiaozuonensis TaxID=2575441 RepID=A0A4U3LFM6_9ACTN|nr:hypothetical protein [Kribbella jiaozuonensis]TKK72852.1 hypothetical protein FDA38_41660 [Kribbella jiaozuonensis]TKK74082.1 hypothetical protein FDA38_35310 [Kribbella jiaozuonensis]